MSVNRGARTRASRPTGLQVARHRDEQVQHRHHPPTSEGGVDLEIASSRRETIPMKDAAAGNGSAKQVLDDADLATTVRADDICSQDGRDAARAVWMEKVASTAAT